MAEKLRALVGLLLLAAGVLSAHAQDLEASIAEAERLNVTAPWEVSQAAVDALQPMLASATPDQRARVAFLAARNLALAGDYDACVALAITIDGPEIRAETRMKALTLAANVEVLRDGFEAAYVQLRAALALMPEVDAPAPRTNLLALTSNFFGAAGDSDKAIQYARQALEVARESGLRARCIANHDLSVAFEEAGRLADALATRRESIDVCAAADDPVHLGISQVYLGHLLRITDPSGQAMPEAIAVLEQGIAGLEAGGYRDGVLLGRIRLGQALLAGGDPEAADRIVRPMLAELEALELWRNLERAHRLLSDIASARDDHEQAIEHLRAGQAADERLLDRERAARVAYLQADFDIRRKEQEIALLRERNAVLRLEEETQRQRRYLAVGGTAALGIIVVLLLGLLARSRVARRRLEWLSTHDGLTGLLNHSTFFGTAEFALASSRRESKPYVLLLADVDLFKKINDEYGHPKGDAVLRRVGGLFKSSFGEHGLIGRVGGEEFAVALPGFERDRAIELIRSFKSRLAANSEETSGPAVTLSFGVALAAEGETLSRMRERGDFALYQAKREGRNRIIDAPASLEAADSAILEA